MEDLQFNFGDNLFNCRVVGVCIKENKLFLSKLKYDKYWTFVGGKPQFGESTADAVIREYEEEVGVKLQLDRLAAVIENFFTLQGKNWHQYIFFYLLKDKENALEFFEGERAIADNRNGIYKWVDIADLKNESIKPDCFVGILEDLDKGIQHIVSRD